MPGIAGGKGSGEAATFTGSVPLSNTTTFICTEQTLIESPVTSTRISILHDSLNTPLMTLMPFVFYCIFIALFIALLILLTLVALLILIALFVALFVALVIVFAGASSAAETRIVGALTSPDITSCTAIAIVTAVVFVVVVVVVGVVDVV